MEVQGAVRIDAEASKPFAGGRSFSGVAHERLDWLQVGRAIAAVSVCVYHAADAMGKGLSQSSAFQLFHDGRLGVDLFFVISGFIICYIHAGDIGRPDRLPRYAYRRITRIYPLYWLVFLLVLPLYFAVPSAGADSIREPLSILRCLLLLPNPPDGQTIGVAWTLVYEVSFYALFAVLIINRWAGTIAVGGWALLMGLSSLNLIDPGPWGHFLGPRYLEFMIGAGVFALSRRYRPRGGLWLSAAACVALFTIGRVSDSAEALLAQVWGQVLVAGSLSGMIVFGLVVTQDERLQALPLGRAVSKIGDASYSIYLVHWLVGWILEKVYDKVDPPSVWAGPFTAVMIVLMIGGGLAVHFAVERPMMDFFSAHWRRRLAVEKHAV